MVHKISEHYNTYVYTNYFHNSWFVLHSHVHRILQTHTMHTLYKHATLHIPHGARYTTTTHCDFNQVICICICICLNNYSGHENIKQTNNVNNFGLIYGFYFYFKIWIKHFLIQIRYSTKQWHA